MADGVIATIAAGEQDVDIAVAIEVCCGYRTIANTGQGDIGGVGKSPTAIVEIHSADAVIATIAAGEQDVDIAVAIEVCCGYRTQVNTGQGDIGGVGKSPTAIVEIHSADAVIATIHAREQDVDIAVAIEVCCGYRTTVNTGQGDIGGVGKSPTAIVEIHSADGVIATIAAGEQDVDIAVAIEVCCGYRTIVNTGQGDIGGVGKSPTAIVEIHSADAVIATTAAGEQDVDIAVAIEVCCGYGTHVNTGQGDIGGLGKSPTAIVEIHSADAVIATTAAGEQDVDIAVAIEVCCGYGTKVNTGQGDIGGLGKSPTAIVEIHSADGLKSTIAAGEQDVDIAVAIEVCCGYGTTVNTRQGDIGIEAEGNGSINDDAVNYCP
ncbi:hypothetical protein NIES39_D01440 [Arthrospira platensis NIES-39]|nr:hypothetical protein APPUASWS_001095 [Arthrospira platensis str. Paraca]BAI89564.1 hypothetical protein NIES39_D01440 [Arthrospira platensis NIES-39]